MHRNWDCIAFLWNQNVQMTHHFNMVPHLSMGNGGTTATPQPIFYFIIDVWIENKLDFKTMNYQYS